MKENAPTVSAISKQLVAASGLWMMANSIASRILGLVGQLVLAWLLVPEQFGTIALATGIAALVNVVNQFGLSDVLVNRYRRLHLWRPAGFTLSLLVGLIATGVMLLCAVFASYAYKDPDLGWMIAIMAAAAPIRALGIVPFSQLRARMKFRSIAIGQSFAVLVNTLVAIALAVLGLGAYSIAWAKVADALVRTYLWFRFAKMRLPHKFSLRGAKYLWVDSMHGYTASFFFQIIQQCDYLILGLFVAKEAVGAYFLAFTISVQAISLIALNLKTVLFPALSSLSHAPERQFKSFMRSSHTLAFVSIPVCFLQALVAAPLIPLILEPKWYDTIPLVQILCLGASLRCASFSWDALLKAQGRFASVAWLSLVSAVAFLSIVGVTSYLGGALGCAVGVGIYSATMCPLQLYVSIRNEKHPLKQLLELCLRPLAIACVSFGFAWLLTLPAREFGRPIIEMVVSVVVGTTLYWCLSWMLNREPVYDTIDIIRRIKDKFATPWSRTEKSSVVGK